MNKLKTFFIGFFIACVFGVVYVMTYSLVEPKAYDFMIKHFFVNKFDFDKKKQIYGHDNVVIVVVDKRTEEKYRWPWKRELNCKIYEYLLDYAKPKALVEDTIFKSMDNDNPKSDKIFLDCLRKYDNVIEGFSPTLATPWEDKDDGERYEKYFAKKFGIQIVDKTTPAITIYTSMIKSPLAYLNAVKNLGHVKTAYGSLSRNITSWALDDRVRTHEPIIKFENATYPSLAMKTYLHINNNPEIILSDKNLITKTENGLNIKLLNKTYAYSGFRKYIFQTFSFPIRYYQILPTSPYSHKSYSALDVMDSYDLIKAGKKPIINPEEFKDKIVVFGGNVQASQGLNDNKSSPVAFNHPGVDLQATAIDNLVNNDFINVVPDYINFIVMSILTLLLFIGIRALSMVKSILTTIGITLLYLFITAICFYFGIIVWVLTPVIIFALTTVFAYTYKYVIENRNKEKVKSAMGKYMSEGVMKSVIQNIDNLGLGGKKAIVTVLFADIRGFTSMSEKMSAQQVSELLNEYFTEMEPIITKYNGIINKFIGDAIMAVFGEPIQDKMHARNAVKCAYAMLEKLKVLNRKWEREGKPNINIGVGINTGEVFIGNIGSVNRMEYTVIGDTVNLASRLESYNKIYRTKILVSPATYSSVKDIADVIKISDVRIRGKANKIDIYEILKVNLE